MTMNLVTKNVWSNRNKKKLKFEKIITNMFTKIGKNMKLKWVKQIKIKLFIVEYKPKIEWIEF
jgi:hypothetical protein